MANILCARLPDLVINSLHVLGKGENLQCLR